MPTTTTFRGRRIQAVIAAFAITLAITGLAGEASASHQQGCGQTITHSTVLTADIGPCSGDGIIVGADNLTLDLNGHTISGLPSLPQPEGTGAGVLVEDHTGVTVTNGTVKDFDGGVVLVRGGSHTVSGLNISDNVGSPVSAWGEGIGLWQSDGNTVSANTVSRNGPYGGIGLYFHNVPGTGLVGSSNNTISGNTVTDNNIFMSTTNQDIGIRVEHRSLNNVISGNTVSGSGLDGITIFPTADDNKVQNNTVRANGNHAFTHRKGDGIRVFAPAPSAPLDLNQRTFVENNTVCGNAANGIYMGGKNAKVSKNTAGTGTNCPANHAATVVSPTALPTYEFHDVNALATDDITTNCGPNLWKGNVTHTAGTPNHAYNNACTVRP